jgi:site-specific DNA recombinase
MGCLNRGVRKEHVEDFVLHQLYTRLFSDTSVKKLAAMLNEYNQKKAAGNKDELNHAREELVEIERKLKKVIQLVSESGIDIETVKDELMRLESKKRFVEGYIEELSQHNSIPAISEGMILDLINKSKEFVRTRNIAECQNFIQNYIDKVLVFSDRVEILFKINVPGENCDTVSPLTSQEKRDTLNIQYRSGHTPLVQHVHDTIAALS